MSGKLCGVYKQLDKLGAVNRDIVYVKDNRWRICLTSGGNLWLKGLGDDACSVGVGLMPLVIISRLKKEAK